VDRVEPIRQIADSLLASEGMELVDLQFRREAAGWVVRAFIDKPGGVTLADCQEISHLLGARIEADDLVKTRYTLEVSSPGLDRVLRKPSDFERFTGRRVRITTAQPRDGQRRFEGRLEGLEETTVVLVTPAQRVAIPLHEISEARLAIEFEGVNPKPGRPQRRRGGAEDADASSDGRASEGRGSDSR
jgi:ribosome maturation factor RimP